MQRLLVVLISFLVGGVASADQLKLGMIEVQKIVASTPQFKIMTEQAKKQFEPQEQKVKLLQRKIADKLVKYGKIKDKLSKKEREKYQEEFNLVQKEVYAARLDYEKVISRAEQEAMETIQKQIKEIVYKIAKQEKINIVLVKGAIVYNDPGVVINLSEKVIAKLKEQ